MKYWAFISYAHADNRQEHRLWADWLQDRLEGFVVPPELVGTEGRFGPLPGRIYPVFQDDKELPTSADLGTAINEALEQSRVLVVLCSPNSARSHWVNEEILAFKRMGREGNIIAAILWGEPGASAGKEGFSTNDECFPEGLRFKLGADGKLDPGSPAEPIAADLRDPETGAQPFLNEEARQAHFEREFLRITAGVLGVGFETLVQRNRERERREAMARRRRKVVLLVLCLLTVAGALIGGTSWLESQRERRLSLERRFDSALARSAESRARGNFEAGWRGLREARTLGAQLGGREQELTMEAHAYLSSTRHPLAVLRAPQEDGEMLVGISLHDSTHSALFVEIPSGELVEFDLGAHREKRRIPIVGAPEGWKATFRLCHGPSGESPTTIVVAGEDGQDLLFVDHASGEVRRSQPIPDAGVSSIAANWAADLVAVTVADEQFLRLYHLSDGEEVAVVGQEGDETMEGWQAAWLDGERVAVACNDGACRIVTTEGEIERVLRPEENLGSLLSVAVTAGRVVAGTGAGELVFWNRSDWSYRGRVKLPSSEPLLRIVQHRGGATVEPEDHLVVLTLQGTMAWIDPVERRIIDRAAIAGAPRLGLALSQAGILYATGRTADAWIHHSRPQLRWRLPGANDWDMDDWRVHGPDRVLMSCVKANKGVLVNGDSGDPDGWGFESSVEELNVEVQRLHLDPLDPCRLLLVSAGHLHDVDLRDGRILAAYRRDPAVEGGGALRGAGFDPEGGVFLVRSTGAIVHWKADGAPPALVESDWGEILEMHPLRGVPGHLVRGEEKATAILKWESGPVFEDIDPGPGGTVLGVAESDEGPAVVVSVEDGERLRLLVPSAARLVRRELSLPARMVLSDSGRSLLPVALSERAGLLARADGAAISLHDLESGRLLHELGGLEGSVERMAFFGSRDALVYECQVGGIGDGEIRQSVWEWREGEFLLQEGLESLAGLPERLSPADVPRYYMARGAPTHALLAAEDCGEDQWREVLDPRAASRYGPDIIFADGVLDASERDLASFLRWQAGAIHGQFLDSVRPVPERGVVDWGASRISVRILGALQEQADELPDELPELLEILGERTSYERANPDAPLLRGFLMSRQSPPRAVEAVGWLEGAFDRLPESLVGTRGGRVPGECTHLVTAARLYGEWQGEERAALLAHVETHFDRYLQQYWFYRDASWGTGVPVEQLGKTHDSVEELGIYTLDYNLALTHRESTLRACRSLLLACGGNGSERRDHLRAGLTLDEFVAGGDEERDQLEGKALEAVQRDARQVLEATGLIEDPFVAALRTQLLLAERALRRDQAGAADAELGWLGAPSRRGLQTFPHNRELPGLVEFVTLIRLRIARLEGRTDEQVDLVEAGIDCLTPDAGQPLEARVRRHQQAARLARNGMEGVEDPAEKIRLLNAAADSSGVAFALGFTNFQEENDSIDTNVTPGQLRELLEYHVDQCQVLGSALLEAGRTDVALAAYRRANEALMEVLDAGVFLGQARRDLAWHRVWTLQRIAETELEVRPDAEASRRALLTWENTVAAEGTDVESPETRIIFNWIAAVDRIATYTDRALLEKAVEAYGSLIDIVNELEFEDPEEEGVRQRILIVGHYNRAFLCRENRIRGIDIVGTLETALGLLENYAADPQDGTWEFDMYRKVLTELEREYRGDGEVANADRMLERLKPFGGALE